MPKHKRHLDPILQDRITQALRNVRNWVQRVDTEWTDEHRAILHDIVASALADESEVAEVAEVAEELESWPIVEQLAAIRSSATSATYATEDMMNILARTRLLLHAYERGMRHDGLRWQMIATVKQFSALPTNSMERGTEDDGTAGTHRTHNRRRR